MIVNQAFVHRFFAGRDPIGRKVHGWGEWFRIVGVAQDSKYHYLGESSVPYMYVPFRQVFRADMNLAFYVRTQGDPVGVLPALRAAVRRIDPDVTVFDPTPMKEFIGASLYAQRMAATLTGRAPGNSTDSAPSSASSVAAILCAYSEAPMNSFIGVGSKTGHVGIDPAHRRPQRREDADRIALCAHIKREVHIRAKHLAERHVHIRNGTTRPGSDICCPAPRRRCGTTLPSRAPPADRIAPGKKRCTKAWFTIMLGAMCHSRRRGP